MDPGHSSILRHKVQASACRYCRVRTADMLSFINDITNMESITNMIHIFV